MIRRVLYLASTGKRYTSALQVLYLSNGSSSQSPGVKIEKSFKVVIWQLSVKYHFLGILFKKGLNV